MEKKEIPLFKVFMSDAVVDPLKKVLFSGFIGEGPKVVEFEKIISDKFKVPYVLCVNNGTAGLHLAYQILANHDPNAEAIVSPMTCSATLTPLIANNIKIVWADIDPISGNIDPLDVERKITPNTKMVVLVHWGGNSCDIDKFLELSKKYNIPLVEDGAHSLGATYKGKFIGSFSDFTMFSLQAIKHVTSVDGGILVCKSKEHYDRGKLLRWYGIDRTENRQVTDLRCELDIAEAGHKFHMNDVTATIGIENFKYLDKVLEEHRENAIFYNKVFKDSQVGIVSPLEGANPAYWLYTINVNNRDELMNKLKANGIGASKVHARNDSHSMFKNSYVNLPNVEKFNETHICIPVGWWVSVEDREYIAEKVLEFAR